MTSGDAEIVAKRRDVPPSEPLSPVEVTQDHEFDPAVALSLDDFQERYRVPWQIAAQNDLDRELNRIVEALEASPNLVKL